jgi:hypothetical protein
MAEGTASTAIETATGRRSVLVSLKYRARTNLAARVSYFRRRREFGLRQRADLLAAWELDMWHRYLIALALLVTSISASAQKSVSYWGKYEGELLLQPVSGSGKMKLLKDYAFVDAAGGKWLAPAGYESDGASIPRAVWSVIGNPWGGDYRNAAVIHDVACDKKDRPWEAVHLTFYYAMLAAGVPDFKAKVLYTAVYHFGPKWGVRMVQDTQRVSLNEARDLIRTNTVPFEEKARIAALIDQLDKETSTRIAALPPLALPRHDAIDLSGATGSGSGTGSAGGSGSGTAGTAGTAGTSGTSGSAGSAGTEGGSSDYLISVLVTRPERFEQPVVPIGAAQVNQIVNAVQNVEKAYVDDKNKLRALQTASLRR